MKKILVTAAALMLGSTSAHAWTIAQEDAHSGAKVANVDKAALEWDDVAIGDLAVAMASVAPSGSKASSTIAKTADDGGLTWAEADIKSKESVGGMMNASLDTSPKAVGMGGPLETPQGYPACRPGRGDDRCIQLYERGVQAELSAYKATDGVAMGGPFEPAPGASSAKAEAPMATSTGPKTPDDDSMVMEADDHAHMNHDAGTAAGATASKPSAGANPRK